MLKKRDFSNTAMNRKVYMCIGLIRLFEVHVREICVSCAENPLITGSIL